MKKADNFRAFGLTPSTTLGTKLKRYREYRVSGYRTGGQRPIMSSLRSAHLRRASINEQQLKRFLKSLHRIMVVFRDFKWSECCGNLSSLGALLGSSPKIWAPSQHFGTVECKKVASARARLRNFFLILDDRNVHAPPLRY